MKAIVCKEFGPVENLVLEDIEVRSPDASEVLLEVKAAGINFPDLLTVQGKYQVQPERPFVPGMEAAGVITAVGAEVSDYRVGDRVITAGSGTFAEQIVVPENSLLAMGERMSYEQGAGFGLTYGTSYYALKQRANLQPGETVLVLGAAGGVGIAAIQLAKLMGAKVIAAASSEEKLDFACQAGADMRINYSTEDLKAVTKKLTDGNGADVIYDPVGGEYSEQAFRAIAWYGRFLVIGFASGPIPQMPLNLALLKSASLVGVFWGSWHGRFPDESRENYRELMQMIDQEKLDPLVSEVFPIDDFANAFSSISERRAKGKVILRM